MRDQLQDFAQYILPLDAARRVFPGGSGLLVSIVPMESPAWDMGIAGGAIGRPSLAGRRSSFVGTSSFRSLASRSEARRRGGRSEDPREDRCDVGGAAVQSLGPEGRPGDRTDRESTVTST